MGGAGGTSFALVEAHRASDRGMDPARRLGQTLADWGLPTAVSVLECVGLGLPVIATRVGAASELISDGNNGLLINVHSSQDLARALKRLLGDEALRGQLGGEARRTIVSSYAIEAVTAKIEAEYRRIWANN